jgi:hypothetical protein
MRFLVVLPALVILGFEAAMLSGCEDSMRPTQSGSAALPSAQQKRIAPVKLPRGCGGTNGVTVTPCPITLTSENGNSGILVIVSAPGIALSYDYIGCQGKGGGHFCSVAPYPGGGPTTHWTVCSGNKRGKGDVVFEAYGPNPSQLIGYGSLRVINKYAPGFVSCGN